ncbi:hypothetical protein MAR_027498 [Mya arenaria]|uniref:Uncharacterized protein n=1 Tax=Mya arenaria TaxID=6604 RepID=A0ABY7ETN0_MYAAR|nr:hypothetical protein MAR_027498 [Mya arenaria]
MHARNFNLIRKLMQNNENSYLKSESAIKYYGQIFKGLGKFDEKYHIEIDKTVPPVVTVVNPPRNVPKFPTLKDVTAQPYGKNIFTVLDEKDGYYQVQLAQKAHI